MAKITKPSTKHKYTKVNAVRVETMIGMGASINYAAGELGVSTTTLRYYYAFAIEEGKAKADIQVVESLFKAATSEKVTSARVTACIYWTKARMGWKEADRVEVTGADGGPIETAQPQDQLADLIKVQAAANARRN